MTQRPKKLLDQVRDAARLKHCSYRTEKTHVNCIKWCVFSHNRPGAPEMTKDRWRGNEFS